MPTMRWGAMGPGWAGLVLLLPLVACGGGGDDTEAPSGTPSVAPQTSTPAPSEAPTTPTAVETPEPTERPDTEEEPTETPELTPPGTPTPSATAPETEPPTDAVTDPPSPTPGDQTQGTEPTDPEQTSTPAGPTPTPTGPTPTPAEPPTPALAEPAPGDVVISEIMFSPRLVADEVGQWFEIQNVTEGKIFDVGQWQITYQNGTRTPTTVGFNKDEAVMLGPGERLVVGNGYPTDPDDGVEVDIPIDFTLSTTQGFILTLQRNVLELDSVEITLEYPALEGHSLMVSGLALSAVANNAAAGWCSTFDPIEGSTDFGNPGVQNTACGLDADSDLYWGEHDCDDSLASVNPGAPEDTGTNADDDCDGQVNEAPAIDLGELVITEVMFNPEVVDDNVGEYFEIYNPARRSVNLEGCDLRDAIAGHIVYGPLTVEAGGFVVVGRVADPGLNGGVDVDYVWPDTFLNNDRETLSIVCENLVIDQVSWDTLQGWPDTPGASLSLDPSHTDDVENDSAENWCSSTTPITPSEPSDLGSPGAAGSECPIDDDGDGVLPPEDCDNSNPDAYPGAPEIPDNQIDDNCNGTVDEEAPTSGDVVITEIMYDPNDNGGAADTDAEWIELYNRTTADIDLKGWTLADNSPGQGHTVSSSVVVPALGYVVLGRSTDTSLNGGTPVSYSFGASLQLNNTGDVITLKRPSGLKEDEVTFETGGGWPTRVPGTSIQVSWPTGYNTVLNDSAIYWCNSTSAYGTASQIGTPGAENRSCTTVPGGQ